MSRRERRGGTTPAANGGGSKDADAGGAGSKKDEKEGYLEKKAASGMHQWQKRFFVAKKGKLLYWKTEQDRVAGKKNWKKVPLKGAKIKKVRKEGSANSREFVIMTADKEFHLRAQTAREMSQWKEVLNAAKNYKNCLLYTSPSPRDRG